MKKIRFFLIATAMTAAVGGAVANHENKKAYCDYFPQYVPFNGTFVPAGQLGYNYFCLGGIGTCTWYQPVPFGDFVPCHNGIYIRVF